MKRYFTFKRAARGITLIEVVVIMGIVAVLLGIVLANNRTAARRGELTRAAQILQGDIRKVQSYAISARKTPECDVSAPAVFYGIRILPNDISADGSYILFADCDTDNRYDAPPRDADLETISMPQVHVSSVSPSNTLTIVYAPPHPTTRINNGGNRNFTVTLCHRIDTTLCIIVRGNTTGNVEIQ